MASAALTATVDISELRKAIPEIVAFGRRTLREQCVTSVGWILVNAQKATPFVSVSRIDADLDVAVTPVESKKQLATRTSAGLSAMPWTKGMMIVLSRMHPSSKYSQMTGNRWAVAKPNTKGALQFYFAVQQIEERQKSARHSSAHFLQSGYKQPIKLAFSSPFFKHSKKYRADAGSVSNSANTLPTESLGDYIDASSGDMVSITAENNVGDLVGKTNSVLAHKHRRALIDYGLPYLQAAVNNEVLSIDAEIERRLNDGLKQQGFTARLL